MVSETPIRLAVFDCDGTLVDGQHAILAAMSAAWREHGLPPPAAEAVRRVVGLPLATAIAVLAPDSGPADHPVLAEGYKRAFRALRRSPEHYEPLFPGAVAALDALEAADVVLGVATGKSRPGVVATLERHGLAGRFVTIQTSDDGPGKPSPHMLIRAMAETGAAPRDTVMIGDTVFDVDMARAAGAIPVGVDWGYHDGDELRAAGAAAVVTSFDEIPVTVDRLTGRPTCA